MNTSGTGSWSPPSLYYLEKPDGTLEAISLYGQPLANPPHLKEVSAESLGLNSEVGTLVVDQWGRIIVPLYPPGSFGLAADGSPAGEDLNPYGEYPATWPPTEWPPGAEGLPASCPPIYNTEYSPGSCRYWIDPATSQPVLVAGDGLGVASAPMIQEIGGKVLDQWGNEIQPLWPPANLGIAEDGTPLAGSTMPEGFTPPTMRYWEDPTTGQYVAVDDAGDPLTSPPAILELNGKVVDQWGNEIQSLWPPANLGFDEKGSPIAGSTMPEGFTPPTMTYWEDPTTGQYIAVDRSGTPLTSPPAITTIDGKVVDQWGNELKSYWPPANLGIDETGSPIGGSTMPEGFTPPTMRYWEDPTTGQYVAVDETGTPLTSPPQLITVSGQLRDALGYPPGQYELVVDQWGNPVIPMNPPGSYGLDETGHPLPDAGQVPPWPPDEWPPGYGESDQITGLDEEGVMVSPDELEPVSGLDSAVQPDPEVVSLDGAEPVTPDLEPMSEDLGATESFDPSDSYSGVQMTEGEVALDDDFNEEAESLITAGLDEPITRAAPVEGEAIEQLEVAPIEEIEGLVVAGLGTPDFKYDEVAVDGEDAAFKVEDLQDKIDEIEPVDDLGYIPIPLPEPAVATEMNLIEPIETIELPTLTESPEESAFEPIEITVEAIETVPARGISEAEEPPDRYALDAEEDEEEEEAQP